MVNELESASCRIVDLWKVDFYDDQVDRCFIAMAIHDRTASTVCDQATSVIYWQSGLSQAGDIVLNAVERNNICGGCQRDL